MFSLLAQVPTRQDLRDIPKGEMPSGEMARPQLVAPGAANADAESRIESARIDEESQQLFASIYKEGFVPHVQLVHEGPPTKKCKTCKMGEHMQVTIRKTNETYRGECIGSGRWKEVFLLQGAEGVFHNQILKVTKINWADSQGPRLDVEPRAFKKLAHTTKTLQIFEEFIGVDQDKIPYHCWVTDRAIPLDKLFAANALDVDNLAVALTYFVAKLAYEEDFYITDCKLGNFGLRLSRALVSIPGYNHRIIIIDGGHNDVSPDDSHHRQKFNKALKNLWEETTHFAPNVTAGLKRKLTPAVAEQDLINEVKAQYERQPKIVRDICALERVALAERRKPESASASSATLPAAVHRPNVDRGAVRAKTELLIHAANLRLLTEERAERGELPNREEAKKALKRTIAECAASSDAQRINEAIDAAIELAYADGQRQGAP